MLTSSYTKGLADYFKHSARFYHILTDMQGHVIYANPLFKQHFHIIAADLKGMTATDIFFTMDKEKYQQALRYCLQNSHSTFQTTLKIKLPNGHLSSVNWEFSINTNEEDKPENIQGIGIAINEFSEFVAAETTTSKINGHGIKEALIDPGNAKRREAEVQLQQSELFYRNLFANSLDGMLITDTEGVIAFATPSVTTILGYDMTEVAGKNTFDYVHPEDRSLAYSAFMDEVGQDARRKFISIRLLNKPGEWTWCIVRGHNLISNPYVKGMVIYFYDDTLRKITEDALLQSEKRFRSQATILNNVTDLIVTTDMNRVVTSWNRIAEEVTGIAEKEALGKQFRDISPHSLSDFSPYSREDIAEIVFNNGIWRGEVLITHKNGEKRYFLHTSSLLHNEEGKTIGILGVGKDISERKKMEAALKESESFYRNIISHSLDGIVMIDKNGYITYCSPSVIKVSGYEPAQLLGRNFFEFVHPDDIESAKEAYFLELNKQSNLHYILLRLIHGSGEWVWCSVRAHNLHDDPAISSMIIYFTNESKRKAIEDRLRESEQRFRNMINNLNLGVILQNEKEEVLVCNKASVEILGLTEEQLLGKTFFDVRWNVIHENGEPFPGYIHPVPVAIETKKPVRNVVMGVYRPYTNDRVWLLVNAEPILDADNNIINVICSFTDISEQKRLSQELINQEIQKQKLLTQATIDGQEKERLEIGKELHDNISQHLSTTRLYIEVAKEKASGEVLEMITHAHKNLTDIINEIRLLSQSLVPPTLGDLGLIESVQDLCGTLIRTHAFTIEFHHRYFSEDRLEDNMKLMLFRIIQEQVNNIIRHAQASHIIIRLQADAEHIILSVKDNGIGFDLYQNKKGLGLTNIMNRASLFNGKALIDTAVGKGCHLTVTIPLQ